MNEMHWLTALFLVALLAETMVRGWLAQRQIAAVLAHRDRVPEAFESQVDLETHRKAADYTVARTGINRWNLPLNALAALGLTLGGGIDFIDSVWRIADASPAWHGTAVILSTALLIWLIGLPISIYRKFAIEARFGLNRVTPGLFFADQIKGLGIALLFGGPLVFVVLYLMQAAGTFWWLYASLVWAGFTFLVMWALPSVVAPMFNKFTPLADQSLKQRTENLLSRCGFLSEGVFVMDGSRRGVHANAYFTGFGRNKRIVFYDTLIARLQEPEIEAVLAHELGHFHLHHMRSRQMLWLILGIGGFALLGALTVWPDFYSALGISVPSAHAAVLLFITVLPSFVFFLAPLAKWWSRKHEFEADAFAVKFSDGQQLAHALVKVYRDNAATLTPDHIHSMFYDAHPTVLARIARIARLQSVGMGQASQA